MRRETPLRALQRKLYDRLRLIYLAAHPRCEKCSGIATEIHHKAGREGWLLCWAKHFMATCNRCHRWITDHGKEAKEKGWKYEVAITTREEREGIERDARQACELVRGQSAETIFAEARENSSARRADLQ